MTLPASATLPRLLSPSDPLPYGVENPSGTSPILFACDHAGRSIPARLGDLGLPEDERARHIGWDIGIFGVTTRLAQALDATHVYQPYSRLVIDCNRRAGNPTSVVAVSDGTVVPANVDLDPEEVFARQREILLPYQETVGRIIAGRRSAGRPVALFAMHSCTPELRARPGWRPWHIGVLANRDWRVGDPLIAHLEREGDLCVGRNEPYVLSEESDYTIPLHAEGAGLPYVEIEIRQDLIADEAGQAAWAERLARIVPAALADAGVA